MKKKWIFIGIGILVTVLIIPYSWPIVFAGFTGILLEGGVKQVMSKLKASRLQAVFLVYTAYLAVLCLLTYFGITVAIKQVLTLSEKAPHYATLLYDHIITPLRDAWQNYAADLSPTIQQSIETMFTKAASWFEALAQSIATGVLNAVASVPEFLLKALIYVIAVFFVCIELPHIQAGVGKFLHHRTKMRIHLVWTQLTKAFAAYLKMQLIVSTVTYTILLGTFLIIKAPHVFLLAAFGTFVDLLPVLGIGSVLVPWGVVAFAMGHHATGIFLFIVFAVVTVLRRILEPKLLSTNMDITPLAALASLYIGFEILGFIGVFLGPGIVIVFNTLVKTNVIKLNWRI